MKKVILIMADDHWSDSQKQFYPFVQHLAFHKIQSKFTYGVTNFSPNRFKHLIDFLSEKNFKFNPFSKTLNRNFKAGDKPELVLTFDDGYAHLLEILPEIINEYDIKPLIFIPTDHIGKDNSWDYSYHFQKDRHFNVSEIKQLAELGIEFGTHSHFHNDLTALSSKELKEQLLKSKHILEDIISKEVNTISYPFGRVNVKVTEIAKELGFDFGFTMKFPGPKDKPLTIGRLPVYSYDTMNTIYQKLSKGWLYNLEKSKARFTNSLSGGTILFNRIFKSQKSK